MGFYGIVPDQSNKAITGLAAAGGAVTGTHAVALGITTASGEGSTSFGEYNLASGFCSAVFNRANAASSCYSAVFGQNNVGGGDPNNWILTDPLFEVGNGTTTHSDAFVVYKNGSATFQGPVTIPAGGDIPMYAGY